MKSRIATAVAAMSGMLAIGGFFADGMIFCEAKDNNAEKEIVDFVTGFYEAESPEGIDTLADYVDAPESQSFQIDLLRLQVLFDEYGVKGWENIKVIVCPMSDGEHWVVSTSADMIVEDFDVGMPGLRVMLIGRNEKGELKISSYDDEVLSDALMKEMRELALSDEMVDHNNEIAAAYNLLITQHPDMLEWTLETNRAVDQAVGERLVQEEISEKADSEERESDAKKGVYIVKKGDCLWTIAEKQLGDGMLWSDLYERNKAVIGDDPNLIYVGIELELK